jgi:hypothetical protein
MDRLVIRGVKINNEMLSYRSDKKKIESAEMKFLRSVAGCTLLYQKRSADIRLELKIFNLTERIEKQK